MSAGDACLPDLVPAPKRITSPLQVPRARAGLVEVRRRRALRAYHPTRAQGNRGSLPGAVAAFPRLIAAVGERSLTSSSVHELGRSRVKKHLEQQPSISCSYRASSARKEAIRSATEALVTGLPIAACDPPRPSTPAPTPPRLNRQHLRRRRYGLKADPDKHEARANQCPAALPGGV
jgi:hypothetical protein